MLLREIMFPDPACCQPDTPLRDVVKLMLENPLAMVI